MRLGYESSTHVVEPTFVTLKMESPKNVAPIVTERVIEENQSSLDKGDSIAALSSQEHDEKPKSLSKLMPKQLEYAHMNSRGSAEAIRLANGLAPKFVGASYESFWKSYDKKNSKLSN